MFQESPKLTESEKAMEKEKERREGERACHVVLAAPFAQVVCQIIEWANKYYSCLASPHPMHGRSRVQVYLDSSRVFSGVFEQSACITSAQTRVYTARSLEARD